MKIKKISLTNYRNYQKEAVAFSDHINILIGNNGAGKTNVLESIYVLSLTKSYKGKDLDVIKYDEDFAKISASISFLSSTIELSIIISKNGKKAIYNRLEVKKLSNFVGKANVVLFSPEDLMLIKNGPNEKRKFMDYAICQLENDYVLALSNFKNQLKYRNDFLKMIALKKEVAETDMIFLDTITERYKECNGLVNRYRKKFIEKIEKKTEEKFNQIVGQENEIKIVYKNNFEDNIEFFKSKYRQDMYGCTSNYGVHRDDLEFYKNGKLVSSFASQGEQRSFCLALKLAVSELIKEMKGEYPILLLDDVFSELDSDKQNHLLKLLGHDIQVIITTTDIQSISSSVLIDSKIFTVENNTIKERKNYAKR